MIYGRIIKILLLCVILFYVVVGLYFANLKHYIRYQKTSKSEQNSYLRYFGRPSTRRLHTFANRLSHLRCEDKTFYGYSAFVIDLHQPEAKKLNLSSIIAVTGWERKSQFNSLCCTLVKNGSLICGPPLEKHVRYQEIELYAAQYKCPVVVPIPELDKVTICHNLSSSAEIRSPMNSSEMINYIKISHPVREFGKGNETIAICSKTAYKNVSAEVLIEWFELQRLLQVDSVITYTYHLNKHAMDVLQCYASIGLLTIVGEIDIPEKDKIKRDFGEKNKNQWVTEELTVLDCQARLYYYKYVVVIDKDEFLLPGVLNNRFSLLKSLEYNFNEDTAGIQLQTKFHMKTWGKSDPLNDLVIGQYINATVPLKDNQKNIFMPSRVQLGTIGIHDFKPLDGFKKFFIDPKELTLHHFRSCRPQYGYLIPVMLTESETKRLYKDNATDFICHGFRRFRQHNVFVLVQNITEKVRHVRKIILEKIKK